jgi:hypothetical protein
MIRMSAVRCREVALNLQMRRGGQPSLPFSQADRHGRLAPCSLGTPHQVEADRSRSAYTGEWAPNRRSLYPAVSAVSLGTGISLLPTAEIATGATHVVEFSLMRIEYNTARDLHGAMRNRSLVLCGRAFVIRLLHGPIRPDHDGLALTERHRALLRYDSRCDNDGYRHCKHRQFAHIDFLLGLCRQHYLRR